jgi:superfamily I DNA/RNA helicase
MEATWWTRPDQLDEDQRKVVALPPTGDHLVIGPPGSGKTNLLLLRASYLAKLGRQNIALLTFNRTLKEFLVAGTAATPFDVGKIQTYVGWGGRLLRQHGDELERSGGFEAVRNRITDGLSAMPEMAALENQWDCLLIDEAQDYTADEIRLMRRYCKQIFAVGDDRQRIYRADGALAALEVICGTPNMLRFNYRNGLKICRVADAIRNELDNDRGLEASSQYDEQRYPSSVSSASGISLEEQVIGAAKEISTQLRAYQQGMIGILAPKQNTIHEISKYIQDTEICDQFQVQQFESGYEALTPNRRIIVTTIHGAKGLEFRAVHLLAMDTVKKFQAQKKLAYTGVTRAKTSLSVYSDGMLPGYLEQALAGVEPRPIRPPDLEDLFSR